MMVMIVVQNIVIFNVFAKYGTDEDITFLQLSTGSIYC